jgi:hypothetical protein
MSLITGNKVKKTHKPRYCEKEKDKANKRILRSFTHQRPLAGSRHISVIINETKDVYRICP